MGIKQHFIEEGIKESQIEEFLRKEFDKAGYSHIDIQRTPLGTRIIVHASRPGLVIGKSGVRIKEITQQVKEKFDLENPMLDVKEIENPFLNAQVVATRIARSIERGSFYKKVANFYVSEIMKSGAIGVEIKIGGKLSGQRARFQKFKKGYIKHSGYYADQILDKGKAIANVKLGSVGIKVRIMKSMPGRLVKETKRVEEQNKNSKSDKIENKTTKKTKE